MKMSLTRDMGILSCTVNLFHKHNAYEYNEGSKMSKEYLI